MASEAAMTVSYDLDNLLLYISAEHPCGYFPDRQATTLVADPKAEMSAALYSRLSTQGFRRSGNMVYRPHCTQCSACIPCRLNVRAFTPSRSQQRTWSRNRDLMVHSTTTPDREEHLQLFQYYIRTRHAGGAMDMPEEETPLDFLNSRWIVPEYHEFRLQDRLIAVAVTDCLGDGLSAVYTYFDPTHAQRSLGNYAILWEIELTRHLQLPWLYLGYWLEHHPKMSYKSHYQPLQLYWHGRWQAFEQRP
jgi:arginine-tRNA-protein transferase